MIHAAIGGSTNALLHLPPIAQEAGVEITIDDFDRIHRQVPVLANVKTTGRYPVEYFWYAGGVPAVMLELRDMLHLDCVTVTGKTAYYSEEAIDTVRHFAAEEVVRVLTGQPPLSPVNAGDLVHPRRSRSP
jgi:dihydroxy-acid dehydratase